MGDLILRFFILLQKSKKQKSKLSSSTGGGSYFEIFCSLHCACTVVYTVHVLRSTIVSCIQVASTMHASCIDVNPMNGVT